MKKRDWPEEIEWIRKQDQIMYRLINILSVAAMMLLVCTVAHRASAFEAESAMAAGMVFVSEDAAPIEVIRLTFSDHQMAGAIVSVQDALLQASLEPDTAVLKLSGQEEQHAGMEYADGSEYADLVSVQIGNDEYINEEADTGCLDIGEQVQLEVKIALQERGEPSQEDRTEILIDLSPPDMAYTSNGEFRRTMADYAMRPNCVRALS